MREKESPNLGTVGEISGEAGGLITSSFFGSVRTGGSSQFPSKESSDEEIGFSFSLGAVVR